LKRIGNLKVDVVAMDEEEREQVVEDQNESLVKGNAVSMEKKEQEHDMT
jgi:hypothetical protein